MCSAFTTLWWLATSQQPSRLQSEVSTEAYEEALNLYAASLDPSRNHRYREVAYLAYLAQRARPEDTIGSILDRLSDDEFQELHAIIYPDDGDA
jgi:hypothetical protein